MNTRVAITHRSEQRFDRPVRLSTHWLRLRPAPQTAARVTAYSLRVNTQPYFLNWVRDPFENYVARLDLPEPVGALSFDLELIADLEPINPFDFLTELDAANHPFEYAEQQQKELAPYLACTQPGVHFERWLAALERSKKPTVERLIEVNAQVLAALTPAAGSGVAQIDPEVFLARGTGSKWELAWLLTHSLRHLGIATRFVSGLRVVLAPSDPAHDKVDVHAWSEAYIPGAGWLGLDPSTGLLTTEAYIPFACSPDLLRVQPIVGYREACEETQRESWSVRRLTPDVAGWPFTETQWSDIEALGHHVERDLARQHVTPALSLQLSFVSSVHAAAPEWNNLALGPSKRAIADLLLESLRQRLGSGGVTHLGQSAWFSGDPTPRWRLGCFFRADGQPIWRSSELLGTGHSTGTPDAQRFAQALAHALGVSAASLIPAYEDPLHALWTQKSHLAPPSAAELADPAVRKQLAERLSSGAALSGYVLPLGWDHAAQRFRTGTWSFRRSQLFLAPGDFPLGYRLPLESLPADATTRFEAQLERDNFDERAWLSDVHADVKERLRTGATRTEAFDVSNTQRPPRTALCVQERSGQLYVFLPPVSHLEHYLELIAAVEAAAEATHTPVVLEGYEPPDDYRLRRFVLEPDAGVLRLQLPETETWLAHLDVIHAAYEETTRAGLRAERTSPDGTPLPTGGGSRLTLNGTRPSDSPFLRRPEILRSLIAYWQRHPSLSYFFSGRSIGAGGPAPRVDEGRDEALYELSIALGRLPESEHPPLWEADRLLRHLLTDLTGNLKQAEICVDQLYAPDRASGRQGRIAIRAFETAPHARVAVLQSLLVQGLIGRFAHSADDGTLQRWGTQLHDRFMLPQVLWEDLRSVIADLNAAGYPFQLEWFESLAKLRFPVLGQVPIGPISLELQTAHEPWPLLAEELSGQGVSRFIDAANERLQTRLSGLTPGRYVLACNGQRVPLQSTGVHGEFVAGVRYKIANPPATLHPTIPPVSALVFDLLDLWTGRAVGGATYLPPQPQLWGPVGSPLPAPRVPSVGELTEPIRIEPPLPSLSLAPIGGSGRFLPYGSGLARMEPPPEQHDPEYPYLLDLTQH